MNIRRLKNTKMTEKEMDAHYTALAKGEVQKPSNDFYDRCKGAIVGLFVGDALGQPIEFASKLCHKWVDKMEYGEVWGIPKGAITDDSSMALNIMQGFMDDPEHYDVRNVAKAFVAWMDKGQWSVTGNCFDIGSSCSSGLHAFKATGSVVNGSSYSNGCGGIMRFAPSWMIAVKLGKTLKERLDIMLAINDIDHHNTECDAAVKALASDLDKHLSCKPERTRYLGNWKSWRTPTGSGRAAGCYETALWAFDYTNNFRDAVVACVNLGGDTDSCGAVCGQIAGSYYGYKAIPTEWVDALVWRDKLLAFVDEFLEATIASPKADEDAA